MSLLVLKFTNKYLTNIIQYNIIEIERLFVCDINIRKVGVAGLPAFYER